MLRTNMDLSAQKLQAALLLSHHALPLLLRFKCLQANRQQTIWGEGGREIEIQHMK